MDLKKSDTETTHGSGESLETSSSSSPSSSSNNSNGKSSSSSSSSGKENNNSASFLLTATTPSKVATAFQSVFTPKRGKLKDVFGKNGRPSPPQNSDGTEVDMNIADVEQRMNELGFIVTLLPADHYGKLSWIIGKGLDKIILQKKGPLYGRILLKQLLQPTDCIGRRLDSIYRSDGDCTFPSNEICPFAFMKEHLGVDAWGDNTYTIYSDPDHPNVEYFCREQTTWGNCSMQGPILAHWILSLWHDKDKKASDVQMIHMSKYFRNALPNEALYNHIVEEGGEYSEKNAIMIMPEAFKNKRAPYDGVFKFEEVVDDLKKRGPALVEMDTLFQDFQEEGKVVYAGVPPEGSKRLEGGGHGMLLIGLFQDTNVHAAACSTSNDPQYHFTLDDNLGSPLTQVHLLLQNWWPGKPFIKVRLDYFLHCGGHIIFSNGNKVKEVTSESYFTKTNHIRRAVTSALLEKGNVRPTVKRAG